MYHIRHTVAEIKVEDYIRNYRDVEKFIAFCRECNRYGTCWTCPPFSFDPDKYLSSCKTAYIIGSKIILNPGLIKNNTGELCTKTSYGIIKKVRNGLDWRLLEMEKRYPGSKAFFAGTCHICQPENCTRIEGKPCIAPDKIRPSLEAFGFDIGKTSSRLLNIEMKWSSQGILPEYLTLVSGFFTSEKISQPYLISSVTEQS